MPLVFVHGVNTRRGEQPEEQEVFDNAAAMTYAQLAGTVFDEPVRPKDDTRPFTPYWGDLGAKPARGLACLPRKGLQQLAVGQLGERRLQEATAANLDAEVLLEAGIKVNPLLTLARTRSLGAAVDVIFAGVGNAPLPGNVLSPAELKAVLPDAARLAAAAEAYAAANPAPAWLTAVNDDDEFLVKLFNEVKLPPASGGVQTLGIGSKLWSFLKNGADAAGNVVKAVVGAVGSAAGAVAGAAGSAVGAVTGAAGRLAKKGTRDGFLLISGYVRPTASVFAARFLGDVFTYLNGRQPIADRVLAGVNAAAKKARDTGGPLYLVGHSFGGIILYDILTHFRPDLPCDVLVTVGSQVALFAELGLLAEAKKIESAFAVGPTATAPRPPNVRRWLNVFDPTDFVGFGTLGVFAGAWDFPFATDALPVVSHSAYFDTPRFFARLRERVREALASPTGTDQPLGGGS